MIKKYPFLVVLFISSQLISQKIDNSKKDLMEATRNISNNSSTSSGSAQSRTSNVIGLTVLELIFQGVFEQLTRPKKDTGFSDNGINPRNILSRYPYFGDKVGNFTAAPDGKKIRLELETNFIRESNNLLGWHFKSKFRPLPAFYFQADYRMLVENEKIDNTTTRLNFLDVSFGNDFVREEQFNLAWTAGMLYIGSGVDEYGISFGTNAEIFPVKKFSIYLSGKWGVANEIPLHIYELQGKYHIKRSYISLGYQRYKIGSPNYNMLGLGLGIYL